MSKAVLISIRPKWCELIASGHKTIEIRKTRPQIKTPFKCYIYCTNNGDILYSVNGKVQPCNSFEINLKENSRISELNGYVIGEFVCDKIESAYDDFISEKGWEELKRLSCLTGNQMDEYAEGKNIYGWHISDLKIYDEPKTLTDYMKHPCDFAADCGACERAKWGKGRTFEGCEFDVQRPPQSFMYVEELP